MRCAVPGFGAAWGLALALGCSGAGARGGGGPQGGGASGGGGGVATADVDGGAGSAGDAGATAAAVGDGFTPPSAALSAEVARYFTEGNAAYARGDFPAAARAFREAYERSQSPDMAFNLARVYERMSEVTDAVHFFEVVLAGNPDAAQREEIQRRIAGLRAIEQRRRDGIAQAPPSTDALTAEGLRWFTNGLTHYRRRQFPQALMAFEQAYQYTHIPELFYNLGMTHERLGHTAQAVEFLQEYLESRRGTPEEAEIQQRIQQLQQHR